MSETSNEDYGSGQSSEEENSNGQISYSEALVEWRSSDQVENGSPSTLPAYSNIDEFGSKHSELYGKHTWKIEKYSEMNKPALRSDVFDAGGYKWYILIYSQECDGCNYLNLYLCLTNHEELHPGWSHFAQHTLALMNKDPKKSIYLDSVDWFTKKKDSGGWNNFIQLPKLQDGYIDDLGSLIIKAKVQVISERVDKPLRCLSSQYRRELVRVYLPYVENICWHFIDIERNKFSDLMQNKEEWQSFSSFWSRLDKKTRREMSRDNMDVILNMAAKLFFVMGKGTSALMMDSLYSGWKAIEGQTKKKKSRKRQMDNVELPAVPAPFVSVDQDMFVLVEDLLVLLQETVMAPFHIKDSKVGNVGEEYSKEAIERDESRLAEVGRRTLEILVLKRIYSNRVCFAYKEHTAWQRQEELIHEEEEEWLAESKKKAKRGITEKERKSKKKQAKQKKNKKEKRKEERLRSQTEERDSEKEEGVREKTESSAEKPDTLGEISPVHCELDASEIHHPPSEDPSRGRSSSISLHNGVAETKYISVFSDESVQSGVANGSSYKENVSNWQTKNWRRKGKTPPRKITGSNSLATETEDQPSRHASNPKSQSHSSETRRVGGTDVVTKEAQNPREHNPVSKDRGTVQTQEKSPSVFSPPKASPWNLPSVAQAKPEKRDVFNVDTVPNRKAISTRSPLSDQASPSMSRPLRAPTFLPKQGAPTVPAARTSTTTVSAARTSTTPFACPVSSTGRVSAPTHSQTYIPQSYKHAVVGSLSSDHSSSQSTGTSALLSLSDQSGFPVNVGSADVSSPGLLLTGGSSSNRDTTATTISGNHRMNAYNTLISASMRRAAQILMTNEFPHLGIINDLLEEEHGLMNTSEYRIPQWLNDVYSFLADLGISGRSRRYSDDRFYQSYGEYMSGSSSSLYGNRQMDGLTRQTQWQSANMDSSLLAMRSQNNASESTYSNFDLNSSNPNLSARINGYRAFRPSNRN